MHQIHTVACVLALSLLAGSARAQTANQPGSAVQVRQGPAIGTLNGFIEGRGQLPPGVRFVARQGAIEATLLDDALVLQPLPRQDLPSRHERLLAHADFLEDPFSDAARLAEPPAPEPVPGPPLTLRFPGARAPEGEGLLPTKHHFLLASGSARDIPGYERVVYREAAPGIDVVVRTGGGSFAYDLHVAPGADLDALTIEIEGAHDAALIGDDVLALETAAGRVEMRIGASWEVDPTTGARVGVASRYRVLAGTDGRLRLGFEAPGRDSSRALVLDPSLVYATYLGGSFINEFIAMAVAPDGSVVLGQDGPAPTTPGAFNRLPNDLWVGKLSSDGSTLEWGTYLGGSSTDVFSDLALDQDGTVVVFGHTWSADFPVTPGSLDTVKAGTSSTSDLFVGRLAADGGSLVWSTFYGGDNYEVSQECVAIAPDGDVVIYAKPVAATPPATPGTIDDIFGSNDYLLARISADGTQLVFQTYFLGGVEDMAFDTDSNIYLTGGAGSQFPFTTPGAYKEALGPGAIDGDAHVTKLDPLATEVIWSTYLGGDEGSDRSESIALDATGAVYVAGRTSSDDFPITTGQPHQSGSYDGYVTKLLPGGSGLVWSRLLFSCCAHSTIHSSLAVDHAGNPIVAGYSNTAGFPVTPDALQPTYNGGTADAHLTKLDAFGEGLNYSTYFGGGGGDTQPHLDLDGSGNVVVAMDSGSNNIPVTPGAYDQDYSGDDVVIAKFTMPMAPWRVLGGSIAGSDDTPNLAGAGDLTPGSPTRLRVVGGAPSVPATLVLSIPSHGALPVLGSGPGITPSGLGVLLVTNAQGIIDLTFPWPALPAGLRITAQARIQDAGAPGGWSASNKLLLFSK